MDNEDDVVIEDSHLYTDKREKVLDDVEVFYRVWANGYPLKPNHCVRLIYAKKDQDKPAIEEEVSPDLMAQVWAEIPDWKKEEAAALRRVAA